MATFSFTSDLHLTDRERDSYRWQFFPWFRKACRQRKATAAFILGDLTDRKDHHSARLVNRIVLELRLLAEVCPLWILKGNHDYIDPRVPYFRFLTELRHPRIHFAWQNEALDLKGRRIWLLPHTRSPRADWTKFNREWRKHADFLLMHQSFIGARLANGTRMREGLNARYFIETGVTKKTTIISGDIHLPQRVRMLHYVGAPYRVDFGDNYTPRVLFSKDGKLESLPTPMPRRATLRLLGSGRLEEAATVMGVSEGDQVKIRVELPRTDFGDWKEIRQDLLRRAERAGLEVYGVEMSLKQEERPRLLRDVVSGEALSPPTTTTPATLLRSFCRARGIDPSLARIGRRLLTWEQSNGQA